MMNLPLIFVYFCYIFRMVMGKNKDSELSDEEKRIRQEEDKLFEKLSAPPTKLEGVLDVIDNDHCKDSLTKQRESDTKRQREKDEKKSTSLKKKSKIAV